MTPPGPDAPPRHAAISARALTKVFGQGPNAVTALNAVTLDIGENEFFTLLGPSGCGKTTLLRLIAGFELPSAGSIELQGRDITALPPHKRPVNTVFQSYALFPHMTVAENIGFGLLMLGRARAEIDDTVNRMLALVQLEAMATRRTDQLSGGQQQRVALARALAPAPRVLLLDEPLAALDLKLRKEMQVELKRLQNETGITFVFVTHDQQEALTMSDRIAVMSAGEVLQVGAPRDIYERPSHRFVADFIGDINILTGEIRDVRGAVAEMRLAQGCVVAARLPEGFQPAGTAPVAIRPENATLTDPGTPGALPATVASTVYFGAAMNIHLTLPGGQPFVLRQSGTSGTAGDPPPGTLVGIDLSNAQAQVLRS
jgi:spermidine/putrescine transport system ATP-binding protein